MTTPTPTPADVTAARYLIWKQGAFYRPNSQGYTTSAIQAGRYTLDDAIDISHPNGPDGPRDGMGYVHEDEVVDADWQAYQALSAALADATQRAEAAERKSDQLMGKVEAFVQYEGDALNDLDEALARVAELTAKLEAPVQVDAAYIRAEALRDAAQVLSDEIDLARIAMPQVVPILAAVRRAILAMIPTPSPSPDVGALVWQDIATAPKDGTWFWGSVDHDAIAMTWHPEFDAFVSSWREMSFAPSYGGGVKPHSPVSHDPREWMPMPARALAAQEGGDDPHS